MGKGFLMCARIAISRRYQSTGRIRTYNLRIRSPRLYPLSYGATVISGQRSGGYVVKIRERASSLAGAAWINCNAGARR